MSRIHCMLKRRCLLCSGCSLMLVSDQSCIPHPVLSFETRRFACDADANLCSAAFVPSQKIYCLKSCLFATAFTLTAIQEKPKLMPGSAFLASEHVRSNCCSGMVKGKPTDPDKILAQKHRGHALQAVLKASKKGDTAAKARAIEALHKGNENKAKGHALQQGLRYKKQGDLEKAKHAFEGVGKKGWHAKK
uniref:Uncharacterized protein n=2 Tax=Chrysotila carterae TaxID=13221 RepID=A0A7S4B4R8_CHRCT